MKVKTLNHWYKNYISDYHKDKEQEFFMGSIAYAVDDDTGEVAKEQVVHVLQPDNVGTHMCIDEKMIGKRYCTVLSNAKSGKLAMLLESMDPKLISDALSILGAGVLQKVKHIGSDMSPMYKKICTHSFDQAILTVDKFHVMKQVIDFVQGVRIEQKNILAADDNTQVSHTPWTKKQLLTKSRYLLMKAKENWSDDEKTMAGYLFMYYPRVELAYKYVQRLRTWYSVENKLRPEWWLEKQLEQWVENIEIDFPKASKFIRKLLIKHEQHIINYFKDGMTSSKAENLNGKIQRFIAANYGLRNRDFFYYRLQVYFS